MGKTAEYVCSGGPMGGTCIKIDDKAPVDKNTGERRVDLDHTDEDGTKWKLQYNLRIHDHNSQELALTFIGRASVE